MSIFIAPDAEGTLTVWADVPGKDPVALITRDDLFNVGLPVVHTASAEHYAAAGGVSDLWWLIVSNMPVRADA